MTKRTFYDVLQVSRNADPETIKAAYKSLVQRFHPDKNPGNPNAEKNIKILTRAYEVLSDPVKRAGYDAALAEDDDQLNQTAGHASTEHLEKSSNNSEASAPPSNRDLYRAFLGEKNRDYYLEKFEQFDRQGDGLHASWNWPAFIVLLIGNALWPLYRKMYGPFFAQLLGGSLLLGIGNKLEGAGFVVWLFVWLGIAVCFGVFANGLYYRKVNSSIASVKNGARDDNELIKLLGKKGGVHAWVIWIPITLAIVGIVLAIAIPAWMDYQKKSAANVNKIPSAAVFPSQSEQDEARRAKLNVRNKTSETDNNEQISTISKTNGTDVALVSLGEEFTVGIKRVGNEYSDLKIGITLKVKPSIEEKIKDNLSTIRRQTYSILTSEIRANIGTAVAKRQLAEQIIYIVENDVGESGVIDVIFF